MLAADPNALVVIPARRTPKSNKCLSCIARFPSCGIRDINHIRIVRRDRDAHRTGSAAADATIAVDQGPGFPGIIRAVNSRSLLCFHRRVYAMRLTQRHRNSDSAETAIVRCGQTLGQRVPSATTIGGFKQPAARRDKRFSAANLPWRNARSPEHRVNRLRVARIKRKVGCADVLILIYDFLERLTAIGRTEDTTLWIR